MTSAPVIGPPERVTVLTTGANLATEIATLATDAVWPAVLELGAGSYGPADTAVLLTTGLTIRAAPGVANTAVIFTGYFDVNGSTGVVLKGFTVLPTASSTIPLLTDNSVSSGGSVKVTDMIIDGTTMYEASVIKSFAAAPLDIYFTGTNVVSGDNSSATIAAVLLEGGEYTQGSGSTLTIFSGGVAEPAIHFDAATVITFQGTLACSGTMFIGGVGPAITEVTFATFETDQTGALAGEAFPVFLEAAIENYLITFGAIRAVRDSILTAGAIVSLSSDAPPTTADLATNITALNTTLTFTSAPLVNAVANYPAGATSAVGAAGTFTGPAIAVGAAILPIAI